MNSSPPIVLTPAPPTLTSAAAGSAKPTRSGLIALTLTLLIVVMLLAGSLCQGLGALIWITLCLTLVMIALGCCTAHRPGGILINEKNLMSLSRFQMAVWTILVLGAYLAYVFARIRSGEADPLNVQMDWHLWALMGISTTSLIGSPLVLSTKSNKIPEAATVTKTAQLTGEDPKALAANGRGLVYANPSPADALLTDMFQGDEIGNTTHIDLAKVQMFLFTMIVGLAFFWSVLTSLAAAHGNLTDLPQLSDGAVWLLGISHAGYLSSKGVDHTKTA